MCLIDEINQIGTHEREAEDDNINAVVLQGHLGNITGCDPLVVGNEIKRMDLLLDALCNLGISAAHVRHFD